MKSTEYVKALRGKNAQELNGELEALRKEQFNLRMQRGTGQLAKSHEIGRVRREIARVKTLLGQKQ